MKPHNAEPAEPVHDHTRRMQMMMSDWRTYEKQVQQIAEIPSALLCPAALYWTINGRRLYRRYFRCRFGIDIRCPEREHDPRRHGAHITPYEQLSALVALHYYLFYECLFRALCSATLEAVEVGDDPLEAAKAAVIRCFQAGPAWAGVDMMSIPHPQQRAGATQLLAAWVATKVSIKRAKRLRQALSQSDKRAFPALLEELPGATFLAWIGTQPVSDLHDFVSRVVQILEENASSDTEDSIENLASPPVTRAEPDPLSAILDKERAADARQALVSMLQNATPQQRRIVAAMYDLLERDSNDHGLRADTAKVLGLQDSTVRVQLLRLRQKHKQV